MFEARRPVPAPEPWIDVRVPGPRGSSSAEAEVTRALTGLLERADALLRDLATLAPGPELARLVADLAPAEASEAMLLEAVAACERIAAWAASRQAVAVNELRRRREAQRRGGFVGDEVAARLGTTRAAGEARVARAAALERVPVVWDALDAGAVDARKADVLCDELLALPSLVRARVADDVVPRAAGLTVPQLRARIRRAGIAHDPEAAARAHARERAARYVSVDPVADGMAWLHAYLPAPDAIAVHTALTAMADACAPDDPRPVDARRADALVDVVTRWLDAGTTPDGRELPRRQRRRPHLQVTVAASTLAGEDDAPAELAGYGPITAEAARAIAGRATWSPVLVDGRTGEARPVAGGPGRVRVPRGPTARGPGGGGGSPPGYRPPAALVDEVVARDVTCTFPGCRTPATRCDVDHIAPFDPRRPAADQTVEPNLHALCRHHHVLKTHGGWAVVRDGATGRTTWTAPTGHRYVRRPVVAPGAGGEGGAGAGGAGVGVGAPGEVARVPAAELTPAPAVLGPPPY